MSRSTRWAGAVQALRRTQEPSSRTIKSNVGEAKVQVGGEITLGVSADVHQAYLQVIDQGVGIAPAHLPVLFERFYRAGVTGAGGLGLGLHISNMLVEAHGGQIAVESVPGEGITFTVSLPLARPPIAP